MKSNECKRAERVAEGTAWSNNERHKATVQQKTAREGKGVCGVI